MTDIETLRFLVIDNPQKLRMKCHSDLDHLKIRSNELCTNCTLLACAQDPHGLTLAQFQRKDRNKEGGGLAFLIKNLYYEDIAINIPNTSDLEAQEISTRFKTSSIKEKFWNFKKANWNLYQQNTDEDFRKAPTRIKDLEQNWISFKNTIIKAAKVSIPRDWKTATIIPIKKLDKSADDPKNYRPISLT
ncbi:hypothetical protein LAZ67_16002109, partial [Cordylochernes scorpioides]